VKKFRAISLAVILGLSISSVPAVAVPKPSLAEIEAAKKKEAEKKRIADEQAAKLKLANQSLRALTAKANAATALVAVEAFFGDTALDHDAVRAGFAAVTSPGRCEVVHRDPTILLDAAHNPHGAKALAETISNEFTFDEVIGVVAAFGDKDVRGILLELEPIMNEIIVTANSSPRAMKLSELEKLANEIFGKDRVTAIETLAAAIDQAIKDAKRPLSDDSVGVLITGSVITVGESRSIINGKYKK
jgi:dihydrofolate synthase/folylpolyglutamate synthase